MDALVDEYGGQVAAIDLVVDPTTPFGEFALTIMLALTHMEPRRIAESWDTARGRAIGRGVHLRVPFGYDRDPPTGLLVPNDRAEVVREAFERRAAGGRWARLPGS